MWEALRRRTGVSVGWVYPSVDAIALSGSDAVTGPTARTG